MYSLQTKRFILAIAAILGLASLCIAAPTTPTADFIDNGDGTVTHRINGLTWMRCSMGQTWSGSTCTGTATAYTWNNAKALTTSFSGKTDWRLPRIDELQSITESTRWNPSINTSIFPNTPTNEFWSASPFVANSASAWILDFYYGGTTTFAGNYNAYVRLVRGGATFDPLALYMPTTDFLNNADGTVTHRKTGLMWKRCSEGQVWGDSTCRGAANIYSWSDAKALTADAAGYDDWRLPTANELLTIVDYQRTAPSINSETFPVTLSSYYWTASLPTASDPTMAFGVDFSDGHSAFPGYADNFNNYVRLVRGSQSSITTTVVEFHNAGLDNYFITSDADEAQAINDGSAGLGWRRTGNTFYSGGASAVCRFYGSQSPGPNSHFYTPEGTECTSLKELQQTIPATQPRWNFESLDFRTNLPISSGANGRCPTNTTPVYRAYNNGFPRGVDSNHRITTSLNAIQEVIVSGWIYEGVVMCAPVSPSWNKVPLPVNKIESVAVSPLDRQIVYAGQRNPSADAEHAVWRSDDGGVSFQVAATGVSFQLFPSPTDPDRVLGSAQELDRYFGGQALYVSSDRGQNWQPAFKDDKGIFLSNNNPGRSIGQHPSQRDTIYAYGRHRDAQVWAVFKSTDGGASWRDVSPQGIVLSPDSGNFVFDPLHADTVFLGGRFTAPDGSAGVLLRTVDGGKSWQSADAGLLTSSGEGSMAHHLGELVVTTVPGVLVGVSDFGQLWINSDGGAGNWRAMPLPLGSVDQFLWSTRMPNALVVLNRDGTMKRSDDLGSNWQPVVTPGKIFGSSLDNSDSLGILITTVGDESLYRSVNAGLTWTLQPKPRFSVSYYPTDGYSGERVAVSVAAQDQLLAFRASYGTLPRLEVLTGDQWQMPRGMEAFRSTVGVSSLAAFGNRLAAAAGGALFTQDSAGGWGRVTLADGSWSEGARLSSDGILRGIFGGLYYAIHGFFGTLFQGTADGGAHWAADSHFNGYSGKAVFDTTNGRFWYLATSNKVNYQVYRAEPDGSIKNASAGLPTGALNALANSSSSPSRLYVGTTLGIYRSSDGGAVWMPTSATGMPIVKIAVDPNDTLVVWAGGANGLVRSTDAGDHWNNIAAANFAQGISDLALHPTKSGVIAIAVASGIFVSSDGGVGWRNVGGPKENVTQLLITDNTIYVATDTGLFSCGSLCLPM